MRGCALRKGCAIMPRMAKIANHPMTAFSLVLLPLLLIYASTLQTIPNGSSDYFMIDVGETQIVLNTWGSLHATGYPLYVISGNLLTGILRLLSVDPLLAAALVSLLWGVLLLALFYTLAVHLTGRRTISALATGLFGLTRTVWVHQVIAEIYSFGMVLVLLLLIVAVWRDPIPRRIYWLALIGGIGVAHHRATIVLAPALLFAVWGQLTAQPRKMPRIVLSSLVLGGLGLVQYGYMFLRGQTAAAWVYGEPGTWAGLWDQFIGAEASRFIGLPQTFDQLLANLALVNGVLIADLSLIGLIVGVGGLLLALRDARLRKAALTLLLAGGGSYLFHGLFYSDVLSALILQITVCVALGWVLAAVALLRFAPPAALPRADEAASDARWVFLSPLHVVQYRHGTAGIGTAAEQSALMPLLIYLTSFVAALLLFAANYPFITAITRDATGRQTIAIARQTPPNTTLMLDWGPRHFAVGIAQTLYGELPDVALVDHKADFSALAAARSLITPEWTFYSRSVEWWGERIGQPVYLRAVAPYLVEIATAPLLADHGGEAVRALFAAASCEAQRIVLEVDWYSPVVPAQDLSVFVHALSAEGAVIGQGDQAHPVYGWRPLTTWRAGEIVHDVYPVLVDAAAVQAVRYGLYRTVGGGFENVYEDQFTLVCDR